MALLNAPAEAERFFARLIMKVDDYGRFHADENLLASLLYPGFDRNMRSIVRDSLSFARERGLIVVYSDERGRKLLQINNFNQRTRSESKFPPPDDRQLTVNCQSNDRLDVCVVEGVVEGGDVVEGVVAIALSWDKAAGWQGIDDSQKKKWAETYPACDIGRQLLEMDDWLRSNPKKATKSNWRRFITNWLKRAQDKGGDTASAPRNGDGRAFQTSDIAREHHRKAAEVNARKREQKMRSIADLLREEKESDTPSQERIKSLTKQYRELQP